MKVQRIVGAAALARLLKAMAQAEEASPKDERLVASIIHSIRREGDKALLRHVRSKDGYKAVSAQALRLSPASIRAAYGRVGRNFLRALQNSISNVEAYQKAFLSSSWKRNLRPGVELGQRVRPMERVGLYIPGGAAPLASTVVMTAIPARVAGVREIALFSPNRGQGIDPRILVAAELSGVSEIYQIGGAQAVAVMAYGSQSIRKVDMIAGPGSKWVNLAKKMVYGAVGIDSLAGPSEAMIVADDSAPLAYVAADLLSQAEHSGNETAILITNSERLAEAVPPELERQLKGLIRKNAIRSSLRKHGRIIVVKHLQTALEIVNARGPEHLQLMLRDAESYVSKVRAAGAIFVGIHSPVALGDFVAGPSHVLPTGATARFSSGLSAEDFMTKSSIIRYNRAALLEAAADVAEFAAAEGLDAHGHSVGVRLESKGSA